MNAYIYCEYDINDDNDYDFNYVFNYIICDKMNEVLNVEWP